MLCEFLVSVCPEEYSHINEVTMAVLARRQGSDLALLHRRLRDGT